MGIAEFTCTMTPSQYFIVYLIEYSVVVIDYQSSLNMTGRSTGILPFSKSRQKALLTPYDFDDV